MDTLRITIDEPMEALHGFPVTVDPMPPESAGNPGIVIPQDLAIDGHTLTREKMCETLLTNSGASVMFRQIGEQLYALLFQNWLKEYWKRIRESKARYRILLDIRAEKLSPLPWELMWDPDKLKGLFLNSERTFARATKDYADSAPAVPIPWPIRVLLVVGSAAGDKDVDAETEVRTVSEVLRKFNRTFHLDIVYRPKDPLVWRTRLNARKPHVVHFVGHSDSEGGSNRDLACLRFDPRDQGASQWAWTPTEISADLASDPTIPVPRLVLLNACRTAVAAAPGGQPAAPGQGERSWSIARAFLEAQVPAVIANQADVLGDRSGAFAAALYERIAKGDPLDAAVAQARGKTRGSDPNSLDRRNWALPALTLAQRLESVLPVQPRVPAPLDDWVKSCPRFGVVESFVDRADDRLNCQGFCQPPGKTDTSPSILIVRGAPSAGKSALVDWCMEACAAQGYAVRCVELTEAETNWLDVLRKIRDNGGETGPNWSPTSFLSEPLPARAFDRFNWLLNHYLARSTPPEFGTRPHPELPVIDERARSERLELTPEQISSLWANYLAGLIDAAEQCYSQVLEKLRVPAQRAVVEQHQADLHATAGHWPLFLVLDNFSSSSLPWGEFAFLKSRLIEPIGRAAGGLGPSGLAALRLILVMRDGEYRTYGMNEPSLQNLSKEVEVKDLPFQTFQSLAVEFLRCNKVSDDQADSFISLLLKKRVEDPSFIPDPWSISRLPAFFKRFQELVTRF